jgi:hypothetical protein
MIQSLFVRAIAPRLAGACIFFAAELVVRVAHADATVAVYWQPPDVTSLGGDARAAFSAAAASIGARFIDASPVAPVVPSLVPALDAAKDAYARFAFRDAITALDALHRDAHAAGGGDLDGRQLSEMFLYRGLAKLEATSADTAAWDDLVNAARLEPTRVLDPARFPPRAVAAYKRAAVEAAQLPRADLLLEVPADAVVHVDGALSSPAASVTLGQHFVSLAADGFEHWAAAISVASDPTRFKPPIHPHRPPPVDRLVALAGEPEPQRLLVGVLERAPGGWTFTVRDIPLPDGRIVSDSVALGDVPTRAAVAALVRRLRAPPAVAEPRRRWVPWVIGACSAVLLGAGIAFAVSGDGSPNVVGELGPWR